jgi:phage terminase small subunit
MRGRKPKPTAVKLVDGTQRCRINRNEPKSLPGSLVPPASLTRLKAIEHWKEMAPVLSEMGLLTKASRFALAQLCNEYAYMSTTAYSRNGGSRDRYIKLLCEFGLTPSSQSRIKVVPEPPKDKLQELLDKRPSAKKL